ncbi:Leukocyte-associated immunoglobulin-like receptor 1 [Myotis brandtii]|nr:Leukocyte-associated immunoglobulin-like receptor 1 [Myotis brandtii]
MEPEILLCFLPGVLPIPTLRAEPGPVVPLGQPVTFVCRGPAWADFFHLEKDGRRIYLYHKSEPQDGSQRTEARFIIPAVSKVTAGSYRCLYEHMYEIRSERSEPLQLQVTGEDISTPTSGGSQGPAPCPSPVSVLGLPALLLTLSPGAPLPLHTGPLAFTPGSGPWSLVPSGHHAGLDPEPRIRGTQSCPAGLGGA